jgi:CheY-like chemotaxis protein
MLQKTLAISIILSSILSANAYVELLQEDDNFVNISLFALAFVSILFLYVSSEQLREVNKKHKLILDKEKDIEKKQQLILELMSSKIETSTKGIVAHRSTFEKNSFENMSPSFLKDEIEKFKESEELLLDATHELIDFLKIKSGTLELKDESYKVDNILNATFSFVYTKLKKQKMELVYNVSPDIVPKLRGDSKRIEQILSTIIQEASSNMYGEMIELSMKISSKKSPMLVFDIYQPKKMMLDEEIESLFEKYTLKEEYKSPEKLYMYVAYKLILQMNGHIHVSSDKDKGTCYHIEIPYVPENTIGKMSKVQSETINKRILVGVVHGNLERVLETKLSQMATDIEIYDKRNATQYLHNLDQYDILIFDRILLDNNMVRSLERIKVEKKPHIVVLRNLYEESNISFLSNNRSTVLNKPLLFTQIEDAFHNIFEEVKNTPMEKEDFKVEAKILKETANINRENFKRFSHLDILIVEDNVMNQKILKGVFSLSGMNITVANNGKEACEIVEKNAELDLIFMDINMPIMDGYEASKHIRKMRSMKMLPIIAIDSIGFTKSTQDIRGINAFLHKPFKIGQLYTALSTYTSSTSSSVKNVLNKLTKYQMNKKILDIQKGISYANTAIFYKEVLRETEVSLSKSNEIITKYLKNGEYKNLKSFLLDTMQLANIIGATGLERLLVEMMQTFDYKQEYKLQDYIGVYSKTLTILTKEINEYLKT